VSGPTALEGLEPTPGERRAVRDTPGSHVIAAWLGWACALVASVLGIVFGVAERPTTEPIGEGSLLTYVTTAVVAIVYASVGLALHRRRVQPVIGWLFLGFGVIAALANLTWSYVLLQADRGFPPAAIDAHEVAWLASIVLAPAWLIDATALLMLFPDGKPVAAGWGRLLGLSVVLGLILAVCLATTPGPLTFYSFATNPHPLGGSVANIAAGLTPVVMVAMLAILAAAVWTLRLRYARSGTVERLQLRWFAWACALVVVGAIVEVVPVGLLQWSAAEGDVAWLLFTASTLAVPIAALVAIMRYRLYDIDRLISGTFVLGALTAILAGLYAASLRLFTALFVGATGESSDAALVLTTLVLATSFTPLKGRLEGVARERFPPPSTSPPAPVATVPSTVVPDDFDARVEEIARRVAGEVFTRARDEPPWARSAAVDGPDDGVSSPASARSSVDQSD
jgi:hypothetical protein